MTGLLLTPAVLSLIVLAAHFLRSGNILVVAVILVLLGSLAVRRPWAARAVQAVLLLGAVEWGRTMLLLVSLRAEAGQPARRLVFILGSVMLVTALSTLVFRTGRLRERYRLSGTPADTPTPAAGG